MKKHITTYSFVLFFFGFSCFTLLVAQESKMKKAGESYDHLNYVNAQKVYLEVAEKGYQSEELFTKLANSYYFNAQYDQAVKWYESLFELNPNPEESIVLLRYAQSLKAVGESKKSTNYYNDYVSRHGVQTHLKTAVDYEKLIQENSGRYDLQPLEQIYNDRQISFGYFKADNTLYYASTENSKSFSNRRSAWDGLSFLSLYTVEVDSVNQAVGTGKKLKGKLESKFHESSPVITADGNTMYFTRSNLTSTNKNNDGKLKIYKSEYRDGKWQEAEDLAINSDFYSNAHPAISPDGTKLYFSSDRPGGFGESDIYVSHINADGSLGEPKNLGDKVNTPGKETFPFISANNELYFSSDGHYGLGGLDVFYIKILDNGFGNLLNIGEPVNSYADDFAFGIDQETLRGYISSNRSEEDGFVYDNIYTFLETAPIIDVYKALIEGVVTDKQSGLPLAGAAIVLIDEEGGVYEEVQTDEDGRYSIESNKFDSYLVRVSKDKYDSNELPSTSGLEHQTIDFELQLNEVPLTAGTDLAKVLNIPIIYFDFDKSNIRKDAQVELEKLLATLNQYPNLKLEIRAHTDSRGNDAYNLALSQRRATSTMKYLVDNGIAEDRLKAVGFGESQLVNKCSNGVPCTVAEHQENRRSEFIVID